MLVRKIHLRPCKIPHWQWYKSSVWLSEWQLYLWASGGQITVDDVMDRDPREQSEHDCSWHPVCLLQDVETDDNIMHELSARLHSYIGMLRPVWTIHDDGAPKRLFTHSVTLYSVDWWYRKQWRLRHHLLQALPTAHWIKDTFKQVAKEAVVVINATIISLLVYL